MITANLHRLERLTDVLYYTAANMVFWGLVMKEPLMIAWVAACLVSGVLVSRIAIRRLSARVARVKVFVEHSNVIKQIDSEIALIAGAKIGPDVTIVDVITNSLYYHRITDESGIEEQLTTNKERILLLAQKQLQDNQAKVVSPGISLLYLGYILAVSDGREGPLMRYMSQVGLSPWDAGKILHSVRDAQRVENAASRA